MAVRLWLIPVWVMLSGSVLAQEQLSVTEASIPARTAICRGSNGIKLIDGMGSALGVLYGAASAYGLSVSSDPHVLFKTPAKVDDDVGAFTDWSVCLSTSTTGLTIGPIEASDGFSIVTLPTTKFLSATCAIDATSGACTNSLAKYMLDHSYLASRYWQLSTSSSGTLTITVAVVQAATPAN